MLAIRQSAGWCQPAEAFQHNDLNVPQCGKGRMAATLPAASSASPRRASLPPG
jgi:hypothetical protein